MADSDHDCHQVPFNLGISYVEEGIALVGQDDMRKLLIFLIQDVGDDLILSQLCRACLAVVAYPFILILGFVL